MANAPDVAEYILSISGKMTAMKLQKLVYYAQAWHLVWKDSPLFEDSIEAWAAGPVVRSLYAIHRGQYWVQPGSFGGDPSQLSADEQQAVQVVCSYYGKWSAEQLSELTHNEQPWVRAREGMRPTERGSREIDPTVMFDFYSALARQARNE